MATTTDNPKPGKKPKEDFYSSVRWSAFSKYGAQGMQFVISMVLARLLAPEYFGLLGMATVITGFVKLFKNLGISSAIVQRKELSDDLLSTLFWVNLGACILGGLVVVGISPLAAWMYDDPRVTPIVAVLSVSFLFNGLSTIPTGLMTRQMEFKKLAIRELGGVLVSGLTAIPLAYQGWGVWALVASTLASSLAQTVLINLAVPFRPRFVFDRQGLSESLKFGLNLTGFNIFNYFARNADNFVIGVFLGPVALGYYSLAYKLMLLPRDSVSKIVTRVLFPKLAKLQDDDERLADVYLRATGAIAFITFPLMAGLAVLAEPFVLLVLGEKWLPAVPLIQLLAPVGMLQSIGSTRGQVFLAKGRADLMLKLNLVTSPLTVAGFLAGIPWGVQGVAVVYVLTNLILQGVQFHIAFSLVDGLSLSRLIRHLARTAMATIAATTAAFGVVLLTSIYWPGSSLATIAIGGSVGAAAFSVFSLRYPPDALKDAAQLISLPRPVATFLVRPQTR